MVDSTWLSATRYIGAGVMWRTKLPRFDRLCEWGSGRLLRVACRHNKLPRCPQLCCHDRFVAAIVCCPQSAAALGTCSGLTVTCTRAAFAPLRRPQRTSCSHVSTISCLECRHMPWHRCCVRLSCNWESSPVAHFARAQDAAVSSSDCCLSSTVAAGC